MIASLTRQSDIEFYTVWLEVLEIAVRSYQREPTEEKERRIKEMLEFKESMAKKIATHDYTEDDKRLRRLLDFYNTVFHSSG